MRALVCEYMCVHECSREGLKDGVKLTQTTKAGPCQLVGDAGE